MKPIILMTPRNQSVKEDNRILSNNESYTEYILKAGGIPVQAPFCDEEIAEQLVQICDGLLITGGEDIDPKYYQEKNTDSFCLAPEYEETDFVLYNTFKKHNKPILGICRGIQVIAVAEGASLIQDLPKECGVEHNQKNMNPVIERDQFCHQVHIYPNTSLSTFFPEHYGVNSFHHQALKEVPNGFILSAKSDDGIIEGIEKDMIRGVQWHPERLIQDELHLQIAISFIQDCLLHQSN